MILKRAAKAVCTITGLAGLLLPISTGTALAQSNWSPFFLFFPGPAVASTDQPKSTLALQKVSLESMDGVRSVADSWIVALLKGSGVSDDARFVGKFFGADVTDAAYSRSGRIIAASEAFRDEPGDWDSFDLTIITNFDPGSDVKVLKKQTLIKVDNYRVRHRSTSRTPNPKWDFYAESNDERRMQQIVFRIAEQAKRMSGASLGKLTTSPVPPSN